MIAPQFAATARGRRSMASAALAVGVLALAVAATDAAAAVGDLTQPQSKAGCVSVSGKPKCGIARALRHPLSVTVSGDSQHVYVGAERTIAVFSRKQGGGLSQSPSPDGCAADGGANGCSAAVIPGPVEDVAVSPDGANVYAVTGGQLLVFARKPESGGLSQLPLPGGCFDTDSDKGCQGVEGMASPWSVAVSPDGQSVYVGYDGAAGNNGVAVFARHSGGALSQLPPPKGCLSARGADEDGVCERGRNFAVPTSIAFAPEGKEMYVGGAFGFSVLERASDGSVSQPPGPAGCVVSDPGDDCAFVSGVGGEVVVSADKTNLYTSANPVEDTVMGFQRTPDSALAVIPGKDGCMSTDKRQRQRCLKGPTGLRFPKAIVLAPDQRNLYVETAQGVITIARDPGTGALARQRGKGECFSAVVGVSLSGQNRRRCKRGRAMSATRDIAISPDGGNVYLANDDNSVAVLRRQR